MKLFLLVVLLTGLVFAVPSSSLAAVTSAATAPDFTMSAHPNTLTIPQGSAGKSIILLTSVNGFQGNVTLSPPVSCLAIGCPQYTISPTVVQLAANQNTTAGFTIYTSPQTPLATYNVAVTGTSGSLSHSAPVTFTVVASGSPDFTISANPSSQTVVAGSTGKSQIVLTSINSFNGTVKLTTSPPPLCASCPSWGISPSGVDLPPGGTATSILTFYTTTGTPPTNWVVKVTGTSGSISHSVNVTFTVVSSPRAPDFTMTANPSSLNVPAGTTGKSTITLTSLNGFSGTVNLYTSPSPLCPSPACSAWSIDPTSVNLVPNGTATATLSIFGGTQGGYGNVTVYGNSGGLSHSVIVSFKITPSPDFTIALSPSSQTVRKGSTTTFTIQVTGTNGFNNTVYLTATIAPITRHGPAISLPSSVGPYSTSTLTVSTTRSTQTGTYTITVTATSGSLTHTSTVTVTATS